MPPIKTGIFAFEIVTIIPRFLPCVNYKIKTKQKENEKMKYVCDVCGWEYDEALGDAEHGIAPGTKFEDLPADFECPLCGVDKDHFSKAE